MILPLAIMGTLILMPSAAMAAGDHKAGTNPAVTSVSVQSADCDIRRGSYNGLRICGWGIVDYQWPNGRWETFVVGSDYAVWHIWQRWPGDTTWSGWHSMGGIARSGVGLWRHSPLTIYVLGTDNSYWCNKLEREWSGWHKWAC